MISTLSPTARLIGSIIVADALVIVASAIFIASVTFTICGSPPSEDICDICGTSNTSALELRSRFIIHPTIPHMITKLDPRNIFPNGYEANVCWNSLNRT